MERMIPFEKYEATGNDFVLFDFFESEWFDINDHALIYNICQPHFGVGADGLLILKPHTSFDFEMLYYNADGNRSSFCGNGSRASVLYMANKQNKKELSFMAMDGPHLGILHNGVVSVQMKDIPNLVNHELGTIIESGSPHLMVEIDNPFESDINTEGQKIRRKFDPDGINVNFLKVEDDFITIATYERGVEAETLACGTGVTAAAYFANRKNNAQGQQTLKIKAKGGFLEVKMLLSGELATDIWLSGPSRKVYSGFYVL
ncbi:MAG: diaminopimelate epimerase [Saprospiraceae bacterium]|nr:diaminopimelate epimerase [Saprospiraceae bacterium]